MTPKNLKKRSNSETSDQSPAKKQKQQIEKKLAPKEAELNGDGVAAAQTLTAKQRKRQATKVRKLAAIAKVKEEGGIPKPFYPSKKDKKSKKEIGGDKTGEKVLNTVEKTVAKNRSPEDKLKAKQEKRAEIAQLRKEKRQEVGQYKPEQINLTADEIRLRIAEIKGRGELTKTAKRKLAVFVKKLNIVEGTVVDKDSINTENNGEKDGDTSNLSKTGKRRIRRNKQEKTGVTEEIDMEEGDDPSKEKPVDIQLFEKKKQKQNVGGKKGGQVVVTSEGKINKKLNKGGVQGSNSKTNDGKLVQKKIEVVEAEEDEEDEDESEDEEETTEPIGQEESSDDDDEEEEEELDSSQQEVEEEDDEEEEEEEEEEDDVKPEIVKKPVQKEEKSKVQKDQNQGQGVKRKFDQEQNSDKKKRYILFVGNLPFDSKPEDVKAHFLTKVGEVSSVRIPTKPGTQVPRGFGYVEVLNEIDYEKGLSLHHTFISGRRINVEYTLAGSKQVGKRKELVSKNQKLHAMRKAGQLAGSQKHDQKRSVRRFKKREQEREPK